MEVDKVGEGEVGDICNSVSNEKRKEKNLSIHKNSMPRALEP